MIVYIQKYTNEEMIRYEKNIYLKNKLLITFGKRTEKN
jgi:hypothetical protein